MTDDNLVMRVQRGDREAFDELYQKYKRPILNYLYRFIGNRNSAEELAQETFVRAYINIHRFQPRAKFSSWLYRIAGNLAKNFFRHASYEKKAMPLKKGPYAGKNDELPLVENIEDTSMGPDEAVVSKEVQEHVQEAIAKLPAPLKEAIVLCDIQGFSYEEAAKIMRCRPMTVGSRLWRGRDQLSKTLKFIKNGDKKR